ncbi:MAG: acyl carrier protein [Gammaproteobacteria bacterium]
MQTKESIYEHLKNIMVELFEIEADVVRPDAKLYEDLDIDSIDAVDMIIKLKELTGKKMQPADFQNVRTVQDVVDAVYNLINEVVPVSDQNVG